MARSSKGKIIGALALLGIGLGIAASASADEGDEGGGDTDVWASGGMELTDDCKMVTVVDVDAFLLAFQEHFVAIDAQTLLELDNPDDVEELMYSFLHAHFPECFPEEPIAIPGDDFAWVTPVPVEQVRTWDEVIDDMVEVQGALDALPEGEQLYADAIEIGRAAAVTPDAPIEPYPEQPEPEPELPLPPLPPIPPDGAPGPEGSGGGDDSGLVPENVLQAVEPHHMVELGVERAIENEGGLSPLPSSVVVAYDPNYPELNELLAVVYDAADAFPEVTVVFVSFYDTQAAFGQPPQLGSIGYAVNSANRVGKYWRPEAIARDMKQGLLTEAEWDTVFGFADGPGSATPPGLGRPFAGLTP